MGTAFEIISFEVLIYKIVLFYVRFYYEYQMYVPNCVKPT